MAIYHLVSITGSLSGSFLNTIEWDGITETGSMNSFLQGIGAELQLITTGSYSDYLTSSLEISGSSSFEYPSVSLEELVSVSLTGSFTGSFTGIFSGEISGSSTGSQVETILKSQNWTPPTWAKKIKVVCIGGGGGGGSAPADEDNITLYCGGGGGGGGTVTLGEFRIEDIGTGSISIVVGTGGLGGDETRGGTPGGDTLFGDYLIAKGGWGGTQGNTNESVVGGSPRTNINYTNTGGGPGGRGSSTGFTLSIGVPSECIAPPLPIPQSYLNKPLYFSVGGSSIIPIPSSIAPTGGGGGLGISQPGNVRNDGDTIGGTLKLNNYNTLSMLPISYNSSSHEYYPAFNTKIGLGGKGGNPYLLSGPTDGTMYGGGGGGAFAGGVTGSYPTGFPNGTGYNYGANGAIGAVIIISET
jgi:hypothetical protein